MGFVAFALVAMAVLGGCSAGDEASPTSRAAASMTAAPSTSPGATASPSPSPSPTAAAPAGTYVALGDSLAVGVGATRPDETGYVALLHRALTEPGATPPVTRLHNLAIGGETSGSMLDGGQLTAALDAIAGADPPVALVTLDIGGNDLLRLLGTEACSADPLGSTCLQLLAATIQQFELNYREIVGGLARALGEHTPDARLAVMTYFNPFSGTDAAHESAAELALLGTDGRLDCAADDPQARGMNDVIACVGEDLGAIAVDVQPAFVGHGLQLTHIGSEDIHANDLGYEVIADLFRTALGQID